MPNVGLTQDHRFIWVYMPGHGWRARTVAANYARRHNLQLSEDAEADRRLMHIEPELRPPGTYEVFIFTIAPPPDAPPI